MAAGLISSGLIYTVMLLGIGYLSYLEKTYEIHEQARMKGSGLAKRSRLVMSHAIGKIEVLGLTEEAIYFKLHRSADPGEKARIEVFYRNPEAYWFDDYTQMYDDYLLQNPFYEYPDQFKIPMQSAFTFAQ